MQLNKRTHISTPMTGVLWFVAGPLTVLWILFPIYLMVRDGVGSALLLLSLSGVSGVVVLKWLSSFYDVSYDDRYLYVTKFKKERRFDFSEITRITQGEFQKVNFEIETKEGETFNFISKYSFKLIFNDWPDTLKELGERIGQ